MAAEQQTPAAENPKAEEPATTPPKGWLIWAQSATHLLTTVVETFGWPGTLLIAGFFFVVQYATPAQKEAIIDKYVLGNGIEQVWPLVILSGIFVVTSIAQYRWHKKERSKLTTEVERVGKQKSKLQEQLLGKTLQHAKTKTKGRGK